MGKMICTQPAVIDQEIAALVSRIGAMDKPANYVRGYSIERMTGQPTMVTVTFIADAEFGKADTEEST